MPWRHRASTICSSTEESPPLLRGTAVIPESKTLAVAKLLQAWKNIVLDTDFNGTEIDPVITFGEAILGGQPKHGIFKIIASK
jgi:hypothetical protein